MPRHNVGTCVSHIIYYNEHSSVRLERMYKMTGI